MRNFLSLIILISFLLLPTLSLASLELTYPKFGDIEIKLGMDLNALIAWFYYFIVGIAGLAAFVMLVWGGIQWMSSVGDPSKITEAKDRIFSAFWGLIIILGSYLILQVINPDLLILNLEPLEKPKPPDIILPLPPPDKLARLSDGEFRGDHECNVSPQRCCPANYAMCTLSKLQEHIKNGTVREEDKSEFARGWIDGEPLNCVNWTNPGRFWGAYISGIQGGRSNVAWCTSNKHVWCCPQ